MLVEQIVTSGSIKRSVQIPRVFSTHVEEEGSNCGYPINLNSELIDDKANTLFIRVFEDYDLNELRSEDLLILNRSFPMQFCNNRIIVVFHEGEMLVRKLVIRKNNYYLVNRFGEYKIADDSDTSFEGLVTYLIRQV